MKPTTRPISKCGRSRLKSFFGSCNAILCSLSCSLRATHRLVRTPRAWPSRAPPRLASPSRRERGECSAAEGHQDADYECGVGLLRLNQLDLVTVVASPATVRRSATVPSPGATHLAIWTSSMRSPLLYRSRRGATVPSALSVDNDSARPWTTTRWR